MYLWDFVSGAHNPKWHPKVLFLEAGDGCIFCWSQTRCRQGYEPPRPLTHDLFKNFSDRFDIVVKQVIIHKLVDGVFYASIICEREGVEEVVDARTSDAIALALRFSAPIFTYRNILEKAGIILKTDPKKDNNTELTEDALLFEDLDFETEEADPSNEKNQPKSIDELQKLLKKAVANEDYETAAKLRDEISKR